MPDFQARKRFGQNFLCDTSFIDAIVSAMNVKPDEHVVEIGSGLGALTQRLIPLCQRLDAIEIDRDLSQHLNPLCMQHAHFHLHTSDILAFDLHDLSDSATLHVVGNLPYNITTPLLFYLFSQRDVITHMHFMVQKEVSERLCAPVNSPHYARLSVMAQYYCQITPLLDLPPCAFKPPPKVTSSFIQLKWQCRSAKAVHDEATFAELVKLAFNQRRKTIQNSLKTRLSADQIHACGIDPGVRAQTLSVEQFIQLSNKIPRRDFFGVFSQPE